MRTSLLTLVPLLLFSCIGVQMGIPTTTIITNSASTGMSATAQNSTDRSAERCISSWFGLIAIGDASVQKVAAEAGMTRINSISYRHDMKGFINQAFCVVVRGQ